MLLWPVLGGWPPELDFAEGAAGITSMATAHWSARNAQAHFFARVDMRQYHVYGLEWTPTRVTFTLDGRPYGTVTGAAVPHVPMSLALQTHATRPVGPVSRAAPAEVTEYIDWVSVYRYH
jgi:beta-glucanase (GH16 family)